MKVYTTRLPLLVTVLFILATAGCGQKPAEETTADAEANVILLGDRDILTVEQGSFTTGITITGSLDPYRKVDVKSQVGGTIHGLRVDRGQPVGQGAVMAIIEAEGIRHQASSAESAVAAAEANLALVKKQMESAKTLHDAGAMSDLDFDAAQTAYEAAQSQLSGAKAAASGAGEQARRATVVAPFQGAVSDRLVEEGEAVNPGEPLFTVVNTDILELAGQVAVADAGRIRVGQPVTFTIDAYPGQTFEGSVARIEPTADPNTRQVGVYLRLVNNNKTLVGGLFATGRIVGSEIKDAVTIPEAALLRQNNQVFVYALTGGKVEKRVITLSGSDELRGIVAVGSGLKPGDRILATPSSRVPEGSTVRQASETTPATKPSAPKEAK